MSSATDAPKPRRRRRVALLLVLVGLVVLVLLGVTAVRLATPTPNPVAAGFVAPTSLPATTALPEDRLAFDSDRTGNFELFAMPSAGGAATQLTDDPAYDSWSPRLSPDRRTILFNRTPAGVHDRDHTKSSLWASGADGSDPVELRPAGLDGWDFQGHAEWSPDQRSLVMFGGNKFNPLIQITDVFGQQPRVVVQRGGANLDPAFTPDGKQIVFVGCPQAICSTKKYEIYQVPVGGGTAVRMTDDNLRDHDPMYSPDGRTLAWLTSYGGLGVGVWDIRVRQGDAGLRRLVGDSGVTSRPEFSTSGDYIYTHRIAPGGTRFDLFRVRPDGTGLVNLTAGQPGSNEYPSP